MSVWHCGTVIGYVLQEQLHVQEECPMSCTIYHTGNCLFVFFFILNAWMYTNTILSFIFLRYGSRDCGFPIHQAELDAFPESRLCLPPCGNSNIQEYMDMVMEHHNLQTPHNWESAAELYLKLKEIAQF